MSLIRSVDLADTGAVELDLSGGEETSLVVGPQLQTPKDTSTIFVLLFIHLSGMETDGEVTITLHRGTDIFGPQVGQQKQFFVSSGGDGLYIVVFTEQVSHTDYVQYCAGALTDVAGATCSQALMRCESF